MIGLLMLTGVAGLAALVVVMLAYNHRAELHRRRLIRQVNAEYRRTGKRWWVRD